MAVPFFPESETTLFFMLLITYPFLIAAQPPYRNVSLGSSIVANNGNSSAWISRSGDFAFGFRQIGIGPAGSVYLLAIWFDKIPEKTMLRCANRDHPAEQGSKIQLFADGRLELDGPRGQRIWAAEFVVSGVAYGAMLDSGEFVLATNTSAVVWRSFDHPADTMLPTQTLGPDLSLISSFSETNYSRGRFQLTVQSNGNLVFGTRNFPMDNIIALYWSAGTAGNDSRLVFNQSGYIMLTTTNGTVLTYLSSNRASTDQYYQRATLDHDGVLRHYVYPKFGNSTAGRLLAWSVLEHLPSNICTGIRQTWGWGACGFNSLCSLGKDQEPLCSCPMGYHHIDPSDRMSGCKPGFVPQSCEKGSQDSNLFTLVDMPNTDWPDSDYSLFQPVSEDWCRQACLDDCFCALAIFRSNYCWKKKYPLSNGRIDSSIGGKALVKIRKSNATTSFHGGGPKTCQRSPLIVVGSVLLGSSVLLLAAVLSFVLCLRRKSSMLVPSSSSSSAISGVGFRSFSFSELQEATNSFRELLGEGAYTTVYKGTLHGKVVAVKKLNNTAIESEQEFKAEVNSISKTNHKNLVQLLGYCHQDENRLLVYEFMSNGSLASFLFQGTRPTWHQRVQIIFGTAKGLRYLHEECSIQIIHCDIKPQNVLLDESLVPKIADFGEAKLLKLDQTRTMTRIRGTRGYAAPEWLKNMPVTAKVDVYSFGILLLELVCCRKHVESHASGGENEAILSVWAYDCYTAGSVQQLVSHDEEALAHITQVQNLVMIFIWCIQGDPSLRPNMTRVIHMLEGTAEVPVPPNPYAYVG